MPLRASAFVLIALAACGSEPSEPLTVAAAANLEQAAPALVAAFEAETHSAARLSFASTVSLAHQIEHGAPFDVYLSADAEHVDELIRKGLIEPDSRAVYALGRLMAWSPGRELTSLNDLKAPEFRFIAIAKPDFAPYGRAAVEALRRAGLWAALEPKIVYGDDVRMTKQYAESGNAEAAFVAASILAPDEGEAHPVDPALYEPIEQALGILRDAPRPALARRFVELALGEQGRAILSRHGYDLPGAAGSRLVH